MGEVLQKIGLACNLTEASKASNLEISFDKRCLCSLRFGYRLVIHLLRSGDLNIYQLRPDHTIFFGYSLLGLGLAIHNPKVLAYFTLYRTQDVLLFKYRQYSKKRHRCSSAIDIKVIAKILAPIITLFCAAYALLGSINWTKSKLFHGADCRAKKCPLCTAGR